MTDLVFGRRSQIFCFFFSNVSALKLFLRCTEHTADVNLQAVQIQKKGACNFYARLLMKAPLRTWWLKPCKASREILKGFWFWSGLKKPGTTSGKAWIQPPLRFGIIVYPPKIGASDAIKLQRTQNVQSLFICSPWFVVVFTSYQRSFH